MITINKKYKAKKDVYIGIEIPKNTTIKIVRQCSSNVYNFNFVNIKGVYSKERKNHLEKTTWRITSFTIFDNFILLSNSIKKL